MTGRVRREGGGRKRREALEPQLRLAVAKLVEGHTAGCPEQGVRWTYLSISELRRGLEQVGFKVSRQVVKRLLREAGLGQRQLAKDRVMKAEIAGRDEQFRRIATLRKYYLSRDYVVLSMDVKKKEWLGPFFRSGQTWSTGRRRCYDHDFTSMATGKVVPHGIYDLGRCEGYVTLGQGADTAQFSVACLRQYWQAHGSQRYRPGTPMLLLLDGGGSNDCRNRLFKQELQDLADAFGVNLRVAHYPAYCSKYNPIEHRFFPHLSRAWQGVMLDRVETMIRLVEERLAEVACGLKVYVSRMEQTFQKGVSVLDDWMKHCRIKFDRRLPKWNYRILAMVKGDSYL